MEKAPAWLRSLRPAPFVGTESRLNTVVELLRQMAFGAERDPQVRLAELHRQRRELQEQIDRLEAGHVDLLDEVAQRDRYQQFTATARELLADFRQVEDDFRVLDRDLRDKIAAWSGGKGELLDEILGNRRGIADSDQGRSFHAFYDFLLSASRQEEVTELRGCVCGLPAVGAAVVADRGVVERAAATAFGGALVIARWPRSGTLAERDASADDHEQAVADIEVVPDESLEDD